MADDTPNSPTATPFFSWWRPVIGWISVIGLAYQFVVAPITGFIFALKGHPITFPMIDTTAIMGMVTSSVALGGMRTIEKLKGVHNLH